MMFQLNRLEEWNLTTWVGVVMFSYFLYFVLDALYNIFLHPLSKFPGPTAAAASHIPHAYESVRGRFTYWVKSLHDEYDSPVVRISPRELSFINADVWNDFFGKRGIVYDKDMAVYGKLPNGVPSLLTANRYDHSRMRRVLNHAFSERALREHEPVVEGYVNLLISRLHEKIQEGANVDLLDWYSWTSIDVIGDLAFGNKFECLRNRNPHSWVTWVTSFTKFVIYLGACNRFDLSRRMLPLLVPKRTMQMFDDNWASTAAMVDQRMELGTSKPDFMSEILKFNDKIGLSKDEILSNAILFIVAGSDAVSSLIACTTFHLLQDPAAMKKLTDEVCGAFNSEAEPNGQSVSKMSYLVACLNEALRIYPVALTGQAVIVPSGGVTIGKYWVPGGTGVSANMYACNRSEKNFKDPDIFVPERWLGDPRYAGDNRDVYHPFSHGARSCIGKNLGNLETRLTLAKMIWHFEIELCEETKADWMDQASYIAFETKPLIVKLTPRSRSAKS